MTRVRFKCRMQYPGNFRTLAEPSSYLQSRTLMLREPYCERPQTPDRQEHVIRSGAYPE